MPMNSNPSQAASNLYKPFKPAGQNDSRSPCPALNSLANHSYLPHDGKNISALQLVRALHDIYRLSLPLALFLALVGIIKCGSIFRMRLDLHDLAKHGKIEHNGSLAHIDTPSGQKYAHVTPNWEIFSRLLHRGPVPNTKGTGTEYSDPTRDPTPESTESRGSLTRQDIARARARRDGDSSPCPDAAQAGIACSEAFALVHALSDEQGQIPAEWLHQWMIEERLPSGWGGPRSELGLVEAVRKVKLFKSEVDSLKSVNVVP